MATLLETANDAPAHRSRLVASIGATLGALRGSRPRIHAITSPVAQSLTANGLLALGAIPSLTVNLEEIEDFVLSASAVLLNLGMLDADRFEALPAAARLSATHGRRFVVDPVFADRSPRRIALARGLLSANPAIVKLNASEAEAFARDIPPGSVTLVTGAHDHIRLGAREVSLSNGHPMLGQMTATGCLLGAILAACLAVEDDPFLAAIAGVSILNIAAEIAAESAAGPGSFAVRLIDALAALDAGAIQRHLKLEALRDDLA